MKKIGILLFQTTCLMFTVHSHAVATSQVAKIVDILQIESNAISQADDVEEKMEALLSRAETYLITGEHQKALSDYEAGYVLINSIPGKEEEKVLFTFRNRFGSMIAYFSESQENEGMVCYEICSNILHNVECSNKVDTQAAFNSIPIVDILGPDTMSSQECITAVNNTVIALNSLIELCPRVDIRFFFQRIVDGLASEARNCCLRGGIWKACLSPLCEKMNRWNQKWKILGVPPDPAND